MSGAGKDNEDHSAKDAQGPTQDWPGLRLEAGSRIQHFRIEREIGRGGAGVVYLAHDTKLGRRVAIKSLPPELMRDAHMRSRLKREAKLLASLDHPNIATIHDIVEHTESGGYLILEYIEGDTLTERIAHKPLDLREVLPIAQQIAEAVAAAHEHGVTHRDLKPGNIKITPAGKVKVLDFGLAKAVAGEATDQQSTITEPGRVMGTPAYMSPEQARGQQTDKRCDIWAFGCVLYEMLTGKLPFEGKTASDTLANILQTEPDWTALPRTAPHNIQVLLRRCLEKDPHRRLRDIGDAGLEIRDTLTDSGVEVVSTRAPRRAERTGLRRMIVWTVVCILLGAIAASVITCNVKRPEAAQTPLSVFSIRLPQNQALNELHPGIAVSPDGRKMVYVGGVGTNRQLFLRELDQFESRELPDTQGASFPFFSPDGRSIGFGSGSKLKTLSLEGGRPKTLCDASDFWGASWGKDGIIYFSPSGTTGLWKISADGGKPERLTTLKENELFHFLPEVLPGGDSVLFMIFGTDANDDDSVAVLSLKTGEYQTIFVGGASARYAPTGHLLYVQSGTLMAAPFDLKQYKVGEPRRPVIESLNHGIVSGYAPFCFSQDGLLYYVRGGEWLARRQFVWINRQGEEVETLSLPPQAYKHPRLSPNAKRLAYTKFEGGQENVWVYDLPNGPATQITFQDYSFLPVWRPPDGDKLTFTSGDKWNIYEMPTNGSSTAESIIEGPNDQVATCWSPDGRVLLFHEIRPVTGYDISCLYTEDENTQQSLLHESWTECNAVFSPDGSWIAYQSNQEGLDHVYVSPFPVPAPKKISTGGGYNPLWSPNGKEIFYRNGDKMIAVTIESEPETRVMASEVLFEGQYYTDGNRSYDVSRDGQRFLMLKESEDQAAATQLIVVHNWFEELKRLVPVRGAR